MAVCPSGWTNFLFSLVRWVFHDEDDVGPLTARTTAARSRRWRCRRVGLYPRPGRKDLFGSWAAQAVTLQTNKTLVMIIEGDAARDHPLRQATYRNK